MRIEDLEREARQRMTVAAYDYYAGGADDELTLGSCARAYDSFALRPRVLVDVSSRDTRTTLLGVAVSMPIGIAPMALQRMAHPEAEVATARAAGSVGALMALSTFSHASLEEVRQASDGPLWSQLYVFRDRGATRTLAERAEAAGYRALVLTADAPLLGRRRRDIANSFQPPPEMALGTLRGINVESIPAHDGSALDAFFLEDVDAALTWSDIAWLRSITRLPIVLKGVLRADDAARAAAEGVNGIIVSNHGGRQLDGAVASIRALTDVVAAVPASVEVYLDGGVRRGTDVLKALALGARAAFVGRPVLWALAVDGARGVASLLESLRAELDLAMALSGCASIADITSDLVLRDER